MIKARFVYCKYLTGLLLSTDNKQVFKLYNQVGINAQFATKST